MLRVSVVTSLFPHLGERSRAPFRAGFGVVVLALIALSIARVQSGVVAVSAVGVPVLFLLYIYEVDPFESGFMIPTALALSIGGGLGVVWALIGGPVVANALQQGFGGGLGSGASPVIASVVVPVSASILMVLPVLVLLLAERARTETLDGFVAGAASALGFTLAATLTDLAGVLGEGVRGSQPVSGLLTEAGVRGLAVPLIAAMTTGVIGASIWRLSRRGVGGSEAAGVRDSRRAVPVILSSAVLAVIAIQVGLGVAGISHLSNLDLLAAYLLAAALVVVGGRACIHWLLLKDAHHVRIGAPRECAGCHHVVPSMPFCPVCGVAELATPRSHRYAASSHGGSGIPVAPVSVDADPEVMT